MEVITDHGLELVYKIEERVEDVLKFGIDENFKSDMLTLTGRLRSVMKHSLYK